MSGAAGKAALVLFAALALTGCSFLRRNSNSCADPTVPPNPANLPPLHAGAGLQAPDTRNAVRIPTLPEGEAPSAARKGKCLSQPPSYDST